VKQPAKKYHTAMSIAKAVVVTTTKEIPCQRLLSLQAAVKV
jgi:hypothetical protein